MKKDMPILNLAEELDLEDIGKVNGGTAITAGNYNWNYHLSHPTACINCLKEGYFTGREREDYYFFDLFSKHELLYRCDRCNITNSGIQRLSGIHTKRQWTGVYRKQSSRMAE